MTKKDPFLQRFQQIRKDRGVTVSQLAKQLGINEDKMYKWKNSVPTNYAERSLVEAWMDAEDWRNFKGDLPRTVDEAPVATDNKTKLRNEIIVLKNKIKDLKHVADKLSELAENVISEEDDQNSAPQNADKPQNS
ncbi:MAG: helix-turn-helix domain-containing protein [Candidatus Pseudobacter hemicellulosilyticus]|uniref:Helix-turn-helix domain-containing protein n=1 Tax=Candidatus Pseudobacter hemicellulosilyticus TaxID=3121375 RepID=A0AAJ5WQN0_9BACT|nr:MAG: helix-turn-helix domain-containing protein [Pseudobacter sp.]